MKIAIMGAGLAGLSCALMLEKHGYKADLFERRGMVGDRMIFGEAIFSLFHTPIPDYVRFLSEKYNFDVKPTSNINKLYIHSPNETASLEGNLGFINMRGKHPESYDKQLAEQLSAPIHYHQDCSYEQLSKEYTHIVLATGDALDTKKIQTYEEAYTACFKGATINGNFKRNEVHAWFNNDFAPKGMAYILPHSETEASLILVYPEYPENKEKDKEELWKTLLKTVDSTLDQKFIISSEFSMENFMIGKSGYPRIGNTFFTGNCFGCISPFLGFGEFAAILTGIYAAEDLCGMSSYEKRTKKLYQKYHDSLTLRRSIEKLSNDQLDKVVKTVKMELVGKALVNPHIHPLKILARILHPFHRET
ncbi:NAD(P)/FAD-dependent oxidoreductase [Halobacillus rhizosphaerae]|uniref:NAD(P)/FAD-dependent oxidoreductase n=1 Tax=Halobacillus rhizosphaerae TaxID=3064889 RepID=UPI00398B729B